MLGRPAEALPACREALRRVPDLGVAHYVLARILSDLGDKEAAQQAWDEGVRLRPDLAALGGPDAAEAMMSWYRACRRLGACESGLGEQQARRASRWGTRDAAPAPDNRPRWPPPGSRAIASRLADRSNACSAATVNS